MIIHTHTNTHTLADTCVDYIVDAHLSYVRIAHCVMTRETERSERRERERDTDETLHGFDPLDTDNYYCYYFL